MSQHFYDLFLCSRYFSVQVLKCNSIKSQYLKYPNDITELEEIFFFLTYKEIEAQESKCFDQSLIAGKE